ncbi:MAG: RNA polymerase sigma factor [Armatimonadota bacterium]
MDRSALGNEFGELVLRARAGDRDAFGELYRQTHQAVYGMLWQMVGSVEEARDLTQETYLEAWRGLRTLRAPGAFKTWLFRIAANKAKDYLKKHHVATESLDTMLCTEGGQCTELPDTKPGPHQAVLEGELAQVVQDAVTRLSEEHRAVVVMHYIGGLGVSEMARVLGVPRGTVLSRLARAREALRSHLLPYVEEDDEVQ